MPGLETVCLGRELLVELDLPDQYPDHIICIGVSNRESQPRMHASFLIGNQSRLSAFTNIFDKLMEVSLSNFWRPRFP